MEGINIGTAFAALYYVILGMIVKHLPNQKIFGVALVVKLLLRLTFTLPGRQVWAYGNKIKVRKEHNLC